MTAPPVTIAMPRPAWLLDHRYTIAQVAKVTDTPAGTITYWAGVAKLLGFDLITLRRHRRLFTAHGVYVVAILAALSRAGVTISNEVIAHTLRVTHKDGEPVLPNLMDQMHLIEAFVTTEVELSMIWTKLEVDLERA
jgi:hypothetical protein